MSKSLSAWILGVTLLPLSVFASPTQDNVQAAIDWAQQQPSAKQPQTWDTKAPLVLSLIHI